MARAPFLDSIVSLLRTGYPDGVPEVDYIPLFALLRRQLSSEEVAAVAAGLIAGGARPPPLLSPMPSRRPSTTNRSRAISRASARISQPADGRSPLPMTGRDPVRLWPPTQRPSASARSNTIWPGPCDSRCRTGTGTTPRTASSTGSTARARSTITRTCWRCRGVNVASRRLIGGRRAASSRIAVFSTYRPEKLDGRPSSSRPATIRAGIGSGCQSFTGRRSGARPGPGKSTSGQVSALPGSVLS